MTPSWCEPMNTGSSFMTGLLNDIKLSSSTNHESELRKSIKFLGNLEYEFMTNEELPKATILVLSSSSSLTPKYPIGPLSSLSSPKVSFPDKNSDGLFSAQLAGTGVLLARISTLVSSLSTLPTLEARGKKTGGFISFVMGCLSSNLSTTGTEPLEPLMCLRRSTT